MKIEITQSLVDAANSDFFKGSDKELQNQFAEMKERASRVGYTPNPEYRGYENIPVSIEELNEGTRPVKTKNLYSNQELTRDEDFET